MIRFVHHFNYPQGMSRENGERWYLDDHVPSVRALPGLVRYRSWRQVDVGIPYPSPGAPAPHDQFVRRSEACFADVHAATRALTEYAALWQAAEDGAPGFREFECLLLEETPEYDLLRDTPPQHYRYITLPLWWPTGPPDVDLDAPVFVDSYCIAYREGLPEAAGEDWYLGHHTREGKQLPGMRHYRTWRSLRLEAQSDVGLGRWHRMTELGMSPDAYRATMVDEATRVRFTPSPLGGVIGRWMNISIRLDDVEDFLE